MRSFISVIIFLLPVACAAFTALADDDDQDWARDAVLSGKAVPLAQIIESMERTYDGKIYNVELLKSADEHTISVYRLKLVSDDGFLIDLMVDAASGEAIGIGGRGIGESHDNGHGDEHDEKKEHGD